MPLFSLTPTFMVMLILAIDFVRFEDSLRFITIHLLTEKEVSVLKEAFYQGYLEGGGCIPEESLFSFYQMFFKLRRLVSKCDYAFEEDPRIRASNQLIFEDSLQFFADHIKK